MYNGMHHSLYTCSSSLGPVLRNKIVIFQNMDKLMEHMEQDIFPKVAYYLVPLVVHEGSHFEL